MTHPTIAGHQTDTVLATLAGRNKGIMGIASDNKEGLWVGSFTYGEKNKPGLVYYHSKTGPLKHIELPYPTSWPQGPDAPSPQANELLLHGTDLFISDNTYGTVYVYDTLKAETQARIFAEFNAGPVLNQTQGLAVSGSSLWVSELHQCFLYEYDLASGHKKSTTDLALVAGVPRPAQGTPPITLSTLVCTNDGDHTYLWVVVVNNEAPALSIVARIDAATPTKTKSWMVPGAKAAACDLARKKLFITTPSAVYTKDITTDDVPSLQVSLGKVSSPYYISVDAAGFLWISDYNSGGHVYEVDPSGGIVSEYALTHGKEPATPAQILWTTPGSGEQDVLLIVDNAENARLISLTPPDAINLHGQSALKIISTPATQKVHPGDVFTINLQVMQDSHAVEAPVSLQLLGSERDVTAVDPRHLELPQGEKSIVPVTGLPLRMTAGPKPGKITIQSYVRGGVVSPVFTGTIEIAVSSIDFSDKTLYSTRATEHFDKGDETRIQIIVSPPGVEYVTLTLDNGGEFSINHKNSIVLPLDPHGKAFLPAVRAGKKAGNLIITAEAGTIKRFLTWQVNAKPVTIFGPENGTINHTRLKELSHMEWTVLGLKEDNNPASGRIAVPGVSLQLSLVSSNAHFVTPEGHQDILLLHTNKDGIATLDSIKSSIEGHLNSSGEIIIRAEVVRDVAGDPTHLPVVSALFKIKII